MTDRVSEKRRSWNMSRIRGRDTKPEIAVRSLIYQRGYRFTVNGPKNKKLPGKPDIVLPKFKLVIFVHGCFWHRHTDCRYSYMPKTRQEFWQSKFSANVSRDRRVAAELKKLGWKVLTVWECETKHDSAAIAERFSRHLESTKSEPVSGKF